MGMGAFMQLTALLMRQGFAVAAPSFDANWWRGRHSIATLYHRVQAFLTARKPFRFLVLIAFKPWRLRSALHLPSAADRTDFASSSRVAQQCFFGLSAYQETLRRQGAGYDSYFLVSPSGEK